MGEPPQSWTVALDGGTTNTRARLLRGDRVVATARRAVGVRDAVASGGPEALAGAVREALAEVCRAAGGVRPDRIVAAGMLTSEVGLAAVPHVEAPAGLDELARGAALRLLPEVADRPILLVPGVRTTPSPGPDGWADADVMRGEECETLGALQAPAPGLPMSRRAFLWPGSHTKLVEVDAAGRIARSTTTLAGELMAAVARHTLLAASLPGDWPEEPDPEALAAGARLARRDGLGRAAFLVRVAALVGALKTEQRAAFWIGAVAALDADQLARHPILEGGATLWVGGRQPQRRLYAESLAGRRDGPVTALDDDPAEVAAAIGALAVARRHAELGARHAGERG